MKTYKDFSKQYIGCSDIAALVMVGCGKGGVCAEMLRFGEDGVMMHMWSLMLMLLSRNITPRSHHFLIGLRSMMTRGLNSKRKVKR